jgi:hypothetical protein
MLEKIANGPGGVVLATHNIESGIISYNDLYSIIYHIECN